MADLGNLPDRTVQNLFSPPERWGWEYAPPLPTRPFPMMAARPVWVEPVAPPLMTYDRRIAIRRRSLVNWLVVVGIFGVIAVIVTALATQGGAKHPHATGTAIQWSALVFLAVGVLTTLRLVIAVLRKSSQRGKWQTWRTTAHDEFLERHRVWAAAHDDHFRAESERINSTQLWYPIGPATMNGRVDVVGGTVEGWSSLLATMGASILGSGTRMLLLDLTGHNVSAPLRTLCRLNGGVSQLREFPGSLSVCDLLADLTPEDVAGVLAEAAAAARRTPDREKYTFDRDVLRQVLTRVGGPAHPARLAAAVTALMGRPDGRPGVLSADETARLADIAGTHPAGGWEQGELRFLHSVVDELATGDQPTGASLADLWLTDNLTVLARIADDRIQRERLDSLLIDAVRRRLTAIPVRTGDVIVVAGADNLSAECLDELGRQTRLSGIRLVLMMERLTPTAAGMLGAADNSAVLMRLGNPVEAGHAARFIGPGYRWPTPPRMWPQVPGQPPHTPEFVLDPANLQRMPPTAFVAVHARAGANQRTVFFGDCDPTIGAEPRATTAGAPAVRPLA